MRSITKPNEDNVYRVVVERLRPDGITVYQTEYFGPYGTEGAAKGQATHHHRRENWHNKQARAYVEVTPANWEVLY